MRTITTFKNLSLEAQGKEITEWIKSHLEKAEDIELFKEFIKNVIQKNFNHGYENGYHEGYERAEENARIEADSVEILEDIDYENIDVNEL